MVERANRREDRDNRRRKKKVCSFCEEKNLRIDFKEAIKLRRFMSDRAKILPRRVTGMCAKHQRVLTIAVKRARFLALIPCVGE
ncbi:MAG: 30S ribosomal protein S18 [Oscillospiraceae bacterium]|nr:30S ribosomal protein S18 [Oscillospiraceae bacterium]